MNATRVCSVDGCDQKFFSKTFCKAHYLRNYKYGDPLKGGPRQGRSDSERFEALLTRNEETGCWDWSGAVDAAGYGVFRFRGSGAYYAHRASYEMHVGEIPNGLVIDHLCRNRSCVNPKHLEPVTDRENLIRGESVVAVGMRRGTCAAGHLLQGENLGTSTVGGRTCRTCEKEYKREYRARRKGHVGHENCGIHIGGIGAEVLAVWADDEPFIRSRDLIDRLVAVNPERWGPDSCNGRRLSPQRMSKQVELELGIRTRRDAAALVGYFREDLLRTVLRRTDEKGKNEMRQVDDALRRRIVAAAGASGVRRVEVELELPECHRANCKNRHGDLPRAMGLMQDAVVSAIDEEMRWEATTRPDIAEPGDSPEETAVYVLATLLSRYRVKDAGTFGRAAQLMVDAYPGLIDVFSEAVRDDG